MADSNTRAKIEIRLEFRQLILLSIGTMAFSGSLFALGYFLGTRDGLQSVRSPAMTVGDSTEPKAEDRVRAKPTRAALGEVEFLFPDSKQTVASKSQQRNRTAEKQLTNPKVVKKQTVKRGLPRLDPKAVNTAKPVRKDDTIGDNVVLPTLPEVPSRIRAAAPKSESARFATKAVLEPQIPKLSVTRKVTEVSANPVASAPVVKPSVVPSKKLAPKVKPISKKVENASIAKVAEKSQGKIKVERASTQVTKTEKSKREAGVSKDASKKPPAIRTTKKLKPKLAKLDDLKPTPAHDLSTHGAHYFTVQVKAVTNKGDAESVSNALRAKGFEPNVILADIPKKGRYYRIRVGKFRSLEAARKFQQKLVTRGASKERGIVTRY